MNGSRVFDDREDIMESDAVVFSINDFSDSDGILERHGNKHIIDIYTKKMFSLELIDELNSTYGDRFFSNLGVNQFQLAVDRLKQNKWAKSCFIPLVIPNDPGPRIPCLSAIQVSIRNEEIKIHATFRSQNAFNAYGNFIGLRALQDRFSKELGLPCGPVEFFINFPHIYVSDIELARAIIAEEFAVL
jgi:thymidylate synthase